jgi:hypothetical protein
MSKYTAHNAQVFKVGLKNFTEAQVKPMIVAALIQVAQILVGVIDGNFVMPKGTTQFPVDTANLHDATGVGVYSDGRVQHFIPTKRAVKQQRSGIGSPSRGIDGNALLQSAISAGATQFAKGIWIVLFSTVPYAYHINTNGSKIGRGAGFFEALKQNLLNDVIANLKPIAA